MLEQMLESQLATLEDPEGEEGVAVANIDNVPEEVTRQAIDGIVAIAKA